MKTQTVDEQRQNSTKRIIINEWTKECFFIPQVSLFLEIQIQNVDWLKPASLFRSLDVRRWWWWWWVLKFSLFVDVLLKWLKTKHEWCKSIDDDGGDWNFWTILVGFVINWSIIPSSILLYLTQIFYWNMDE